MKRIHGKTMQSFALYFFLFVTVGMSRGTAGESQPVWNVKHFGAIGDGKILDTRAIQSAIDSCAKQGGKVMVPSGTYLSGTLFLRSRVTLQIAEGATLLGSTRLADYPERIPAVRSYNDLFLKYSLIYAEGQENIAIEGPGTIDGQGGSFPVVAREKPARYKDRPYILRMVQCNGVRVEDLRMRNSAMWMQHYLACDNVALRGLNVYNHCNNNNDMMDIDGCRNVVVSDCIGDTDDDAITIKSTTGRSSQNVSITNCIVSSHCNAVKCGTESIGGFKNISVSNLVVKPSAHPTKISGEYGGIGGIVLTLVDGGILDGITVSNVSIDGPETPIFLRLGDRGRTVEPDQPKPPAGRFRNVRIGQVVASGAGNIGCAIAGLPEHPIENVSLNHIRIAFKGGGTRGDAERVLEEKPDGYPESNMFGKLSAYGFFIRHGRNLSLDQIDLSVESPEDRPALVCEDVQELDLFGLRATGSAACESLIRFAGVRNAMVAGCRVVSPIRAFVSIQGNQTESIFLCGNDLRKAGKKYIAGQGVNVLSIQTVP